jgi:hypothetical protein
MAKRKQETESGWQFPKPLEIIKCREGNKEFMRERPARRPFGQTVLVCEYPIGGFVLRTKKATPPIPLPSLRCL